MGLLNSLQGDRIYFDVNIWIYALEGYPAFITELTALLQAIDQGKLTAVTSELSLAEALTKPIKNQDQNTQLLYQRAISSRANVEVVPIDREILIKAAQLRAVTKLKLPDAIHAATALSSRCSTFLTNDKGFFAVPELTTALLSDVIP
ncbi:MAG: PIN domain-containing protein [Cyanobacteria bacterium]|nr:PIN domain-containing protein [Cyanobacteriota bacterium]